MTEHNQQIDFILSANKQKRFENKNKGDADLEKRIETLEKETDTLKTCIDLKDVEIQRLNTVIEKLKEEAQDMLLYP